MTLSVAVGRSVLGGCVRNTNSFNDGGKRKRTQIPGAISASFVAGRLVRTQILWGRLTHEMADDSVPLDISSERCTMQAPGAELTDGSFVAELPDDVLARIFQHLPLQVCLRASHRTAANAAHFLISALITSRHHLCCHADSRRAPTRRKVLDGVGCAVMTTSGTPRCMLATRWRGHDHR